MKRCLFDGRNESSWTKADRRRGCERAIVSHRWTMNPFGITPNVEVMPSIQPGILMFDGLPADQHGYNGRLAARMALIPEWDMLNGRKLVIWESADKRQALLAFDLTRLEVVEAWRRELIESLHWAAGFHFDYLTNLAWLRPDDEYAQDKFYWRAWDTAYAFLCYSFGGNKLIGQNYHLTALTPYVNGLFVEVAPTHTGTTFEQHAANMVKHGGGSEWVFELREPAKLSPAYIDQSLRFIRDHDCFVTFGRDKAAGVGFDAALARIGG